VPLIIAVSLALFWGDSEERHQRYPRGVILAALRQVETSGRENSPDGDGGLAIGPYQIHEAYWRDAVEFAPAIGGGYQDCRQREYAEKIIEAFMTRWVPRPWAEGDAEVIARVHNGGPTGFRNEATLGYWRRVRRYLP